MIVVDTSVWVQAFRVDTSPERREVDELLAQEEVVMVGPVLAEILQGARSPQEYEQLHLRLAVLPYLEDTQETWTRAGALSYQLRQRGLAVSLIDLVIATLAMEGDHQLYTLDDHFQRVPGLKLYAARAG